MPTKRRWRESSTLEAEFFDCVMRNIAWNHFTSGRSRLHECHACRLQTSLKADTILAKSKAPCPKCRASVALLISPSLGSIRPDGTALGVSSQHFERYSCRDTASTGSGASVHYNFLRRFIRNASPARPFGQGPAPICGPCRTIFPSPAMRAPPLRSIKNH